MGRKWQKIKRWAASAVRWLTYARSELNDVPDGLIDPDLYDKLVNGMDRYLGQLVRIEQTSGAHTNFWSTIKDAPRGAELWIVYPAKPDGLDPVEEELPGSLQYMCDFKEAHDWIKQTFGRKSKRLLFRK